ncbi:MAG TPA: flagellar hook capping FlgD N-terminal domain-containing protein [Noviherbaspirillum sp.]
MAIDATAAAGASSSQVGNLGIQDFLKILTSQLNNQDPLKPVDNQEFIAQIAQFTTLEQSRQLNDKISQLLTQQSTTQSVGMLGKTVDVSSNSGNVTGTVVAISFNAGTPQLSVHTTSGNTVTDVSLSQVTSIR